MLIAEYLITLQLDRGSEISLFRQLYEAIKSGILDGKLRPATQLPPTRTLALSLGISRQTVLNALSQLTAEGYLSGTVGKGTFVSEKLPAMRGRVKLSKDIAPPTPLRPLSARGQRFIDIRSRINTHEDRPKAFRIGMPGLDVFPFEIWARLEARRWRRPTFQLGYTDPAGYPPLRALLAAYLSASRGVHCAPEQIIITSGSQQALFLIASLLLAPGDAAWVEDPGYRGTNGALHATEARVCPVPVDQEGLCVALGAQHYPDAKLIYVTPSHQSPLGMSMSLRRRLELLAWAGKHKAWVVEDDYDSEYRYSGAPHASLQSLDKAGCVIYVGTLSKVLFPGLRLGYMVLPQPLVQAFANGKAVMDRHTSLVPQIVLSEFIAEGHFNRHIKRTREVYAERRAALLSALETTLVDQLDFGPTDAGMHLAVAFKQQRDDLALAAAAFKRGIELRPLSQFYAPQEEAPLRTGTPSGLLLGFASVPPAETQMGVAILRELLAAR
ncbi:MAG TPA: PLP-dependent aminotransferase family protein [Burkholderiaceae bacterium]|jgi:GntR family transcriptional regulator/MocR family aminotransferase|nr:PLP-dependent aminotransferase family protein [Burkholderiaceae bacterium]